MLARPPTGFRGSLLRVISTTTSARIYFVPLSNANSKSQFEVIGEALAPRFARCSALF
jgi:hypothetical protein